MKADWYWIEQDGEAYPARWDGFKWHGKKHDGNHKVIGPIVFSCPAQCKCTQNPDGTWNTNCS